MKIKSMAEISLFAVLSAVGARIMIPVPFVPFTLQTLVCMQVAWVNNHPDVPMWMHVAVSAGVLILSVLAAYGWLRLYDEPVRKWLRKRWFA